MDRQENNDYNKQEYRNYNQNQYEEQGLRPKKSIKKPLIIIAAIVIGLMIIGVGCSAMVNHTIGSMGSLTKVETESLSPGDVHEEHIAVIHVEGAIMAASEGLFEANSYDHGFTLDAIDAAKDNPQNKGILLYVDSPGGGVYESDELYFKLKEYQTETKRPIYSYMGSMAASGGYYISAPCDKIIANRNCWTGSIGVTIGTFYDISGLLENYGIKTVTITSGANKAMGGLTDPMTTEQQEIFQSLVDESYEQFVEIVAEGRKLDLETTKTLADGRIYTAKQALDVGLIDGIANLEEAKEQMRKDTKLKDVEFIDMYPPETDFFTRLLAEAKGIKNNQGDVQSLIQMMARQGQFPIMYMSQWDK